MTTWGGPREGSGRKAGWKSGETVVIRVPKALADQVLDHARQLDAGEVPGQLTIGSALERSRIDQARQLLADHLEEVGRKGTLKRSTIRQALDLLDSVT